MTTKAPTKTPETPARPSTPPRKRRSAEPSGEGILGGAAHLFLITWALISTLPLLWALVSAFKTDAEIFAGAWSLPSSLQWGNFVQAWAKANIGRYFLNTVIVVSGGIFLTLLLSSMVAYVLARYQFRGNRIIYFSFIAGMTFPLFLALVPLFFVVRNLGMLSTYHGLILVYTAFSMPFSVFFLTAFFRTLPSSVAEAALIDGCSQTRTFFQVMLPMAKPGLLSVGIFNFIGQWNQYLLPLVLVTDPDKYVLSQGLANLAISQGYRSNWSALFAGLVIATLPVLILYGIFQRKLQAGLTAGAIK